MQQSLVFFSRNSPTPSGAQTLRLWKRLWALRRGSLAVPAIKDKDFDAGPRFPSAKAPKFFTKPPRFAPSGWENSDLYETPLSKAPSSRLRRRWAVAKSIGKMDEQAHRVRPTQSVVYLCPAADKPTAYFLLSRFLLEKSLHLFPSYQRTSAERPPTRLRVRQSRERGEGALEYQNEK